MMKVKKIIDKKIPEENTTDRKDFCIIKFDAHFIIKQTDK
jgi:hypothetical protein